MLDGEPQFNQRLQEDRTREIYYSQVPEVHSIPWRTTWDVKVGCGKRERKDLEHRRLLGSKEECFRGLRPD